MKTRDMILCGLFAALTAVGALITLQVGIIPFTLQLLMTFLAGGVLGKKLGAISQLIYMLLGLVGLPVFAGLKSGIGTIVGPTGGYIFGFIAGAFVIGWVIERMQLKGKQLWMQVLVNALGVLAGLATVYVFGILRLSLEYGFQQALVYGFFPFILVDVVKMLVAVPLIMAIKLPLVKMGYLTV